MDNFPLVCRNWLCVNESQPCMATVEYPLFTDARVIGEVTQGPFEFINTVPQWEQGVVKPAIILRINQHFEPPKPNMSKTDAELYHGGSFPDEIGALSSLAIGARVRAGTLTRYFDGGDPKGRPVEWDRRPTPQLLLRNPSDGGWVLPSAVEGTHSLDNLSVLTVLTSLSAAAAIALIRAARLYQDALWLVESETALAWLMLVSAVETASDHWQKEKGTPAERLRASKAELHDYLFSLGAEVPQKVAEHIIDSLGVTKKFVDFLMNFKPSAPSARPPDWCQHPWDDNSLRRTINRIYKYRSLALHEGRPFPAPMCDPPRFLDKGWVARTEVPFGAAVSTRGGTWLKEDVPILFHTFEYLARNALLKWWQGGTPETELP
jgi:hypothetical protein